VNNYGWPIKTSHFLCCQSASTLNPDCIYIPKLIFTLFDCNISSENVVHFSHLSLVIYFFVSNPTHKTKTGTTNRWGRRLITTHLDYSKYQQQVLAFAVPYTSLCILCKNPGRNPLCWPEPTCFAFLHPIFFCRTTSWAPVAQL
jgi:hypothetical protein